MFRTFTVLSTIAVLALSIIAGAQNTPAPPTINKGTLHQGNRAVSGTSHTTAPAPAFSFGWNGIHPANCTSFYSGGVYYLYVYALEGGYIYTTDTNFQSLLLPACQTGNTIAFYVYDQFNDWNQLYTYTYAFRTQY